MKLSVIIPVFNEPDTIETLLDRIDRAALPAPVVKEIIVVDDGSDGATVEKLAASQRRYGFRLITLGENRGKGNALRIGISACTGDLVLFQDADLEYDPQDYPLLLAPILAGECDVVFGSRFLGAQKPDMAPSFFYANKALTWLSNRFSRVGLTDMETGFKLFKGEVLRKISLRENGFGIEPEITAKLAKLVRAEGVRITEVAIRYRARKYHQGKKIGILDGFRSLWCIAKYNLPGR